MDEIFEDWFENHFLFHAPAARPFILLLDGHSSHYNINAIKLAAAARVMIFCLPPNTTHMLQPLDKECSKRHALTTLLQLGAKLPNGNFHTCFVKLGGKL